MTPQKPLLLRLILAGTAIPCMSALPAMAETKWSDTFLLGTIYIGGEADGQGGTTSKVTGEAAKKTGRPTLDEAVATLPGVTSISTGGGSRNERSVYVRGFGRWHVPLSIDGIRIYLPADNRLDFGRFLTPDLAEIQVQKSYVSVLNGPGGMGGAINLVTKTPTEAFEGEIRLGVEAGNGGDISGRNGYLSLGTRQDKWYAQASLMKRESDGFWLSRDFVPVPNENGGLRDDADTSDSRANLKFGFTPNDTDEYVLSYTVQTGSKNAPYSTLLPMDTGTGPRPAGSQRDWTWPEWDIASLAFYSHTELDTGYVKTKLYYNTFDNTLSAWNNALHESQTVGRAFNSVYDDYSLGVSAEYGLPLGAHELKIAAHYRSDVHRETNYPTPTLGTPADPTEHSKEETLSLAVEDTWRLNETLRLVGGLSYNTAKVLEAKRSSATPGRPTAETDAVDWQLAAIWAPEAGGEFHASFSSRTSFPTLFHRFSTRFGTMEPNPDLKAERAGNFELGYSGDLGPIGLDAAIFYSRVDDLIQAVPFGGALWQQQNVGTGVFKGVELAADWQVNERIKISGNYTYLDASIVDPSITGLRITDIPRHKAWLALDWQATGNLTVSPSLEIFGPRWSDPAAGQPRTANPIYTYLETGGFGLANLSASWEVTPKASVDFAVRNIFDRDVQVMAGYPEAGRTFYLTAQSRF